MQLLSTEGAKKVIMAQAKHLAPSVRDAKEKEKSQPSTSSSSETTSESSSSSDKVDESDDRDSDKKEAKKAKALGEVHKGDAVVAHAAVAHMRRCNVEHVEVTGPLAEASKDRSVQRP